MALSRDLHKAREAYRQGDREASAAAHNAAHSPERHQQHTGQYIKSGVYGGLDGIVTTFAVVAGAAGADLSAGVALILGFANLVADGLSMAIGDYLSTRSEQEYHRAERRREEWEVTHYPEGEKRELVELYVSRGMNEDDARAIVEILARHPQVWVDVMMTEELRILDSDESPWKNAAVTFVSFALFGFVPLLAFVLSHSVGWFGDHLFLAACGLTAATLFALGAVKTKITGRSWFLSGCEMLLVGGIAAAAAYLVGVLLGGLA